MAKKVKKVSVIGKLLNPLFWTPRGWQTKGFSYARKASQTPISSTNNSFLYPRQKPKMAKNVKKVPLIGKLLDPWFWTPRGWQTKGFSYGTLPDHELEY